MVPDRIEETYPGNYQKIIDFINSGVDGLRALKEGNQVLRLMCINDFTQKIEGDYPGIYGEIATSVNRVRETIINVVEINKAIAAGEFKNELEMMKQHGQLSENDEYLPSMIALAENISMLVQETGQLTDSAIAGNLDNRGDTSRFSGEYAQIIAGFNNALDALTAPMQGTIVKIAVEDGATVAEGDLVVVLEAMKMEQPITAHRAGVVTGLSAEVGATVSNGAVLCEIKDA